MTPETGQSSCSLESGSFSDQVFFSVCQRLVLRVNHAVRELFNQKISKVPINTKDPQKTLTFEALLLETFFGDNNRV